MSLPFDPLNGDECPTTLSDLLALIASKLRLPDNQSAIITQETAPAGSSSTFWYQPSTNAFHTYVNGDWQTIGVVWKIGDIVAFDYDPATDASLATAAAPTRLPWAICDGGTYNGIQTPNLVGRVPKGTNIAGQMGAQGGSDTVTLTVNQIPPHKHLIPFAAAAKGGTDQNVPTAGGSQGPNVATRDACGVGTTAGNEDQGLPDQGADAVSVDQAHTIVGFKMFVGF